MLIIYKGKREIKRNINNHIQDMKRNNLWDNIEYFNVHLPSNFNGYPISGRIELNAQVISNGRR